MNVHVQGHVELITESADTTSLSSASTVAREELRQYLLQLLVYFHGVVLAQELATVGTTIHLGFE